MGECSSPGYTNKKNTIDHKTIITKKEDGDEITGYAYVKQTHKLIRVKSKLTNSSLIIFHNLFFI